MEKNKLVVEGAGASALASVLANKVDIKGKNVAVVISGGNIDITNIEKIVNKAQILQGRRAKLDILLTDIVGQLNKVTEIISENKGNILYLNQTRYFENLKSNEQLLELVLECLDINHLNSIKEKLKRNGINIL